MMPADLARMVLKYLNRATLGAFEVDEFIAVRESLRRIASGQPPLDIPPVDIPPPPINFRKAEGL